MSLPADGRCVVCGSVELTIFTVLPYFSLCRCATCGSLTAFPRPRPVDLAALHDSHAYFEHPYFARRRVDIDHARARCRAIAQRLGTGASDWLRGRRHLDIGCDAGALLTAAAELYQTEPVGIDLAARAVALARDAGIEAYHSDLEGVPHLREFGLITIVDVIEHVADPAAFIRDVASRLLPGGWCYVETPNIRSLVYRIGRMLANTTQGRPAWICQRLFLPEHVQYISDDGFVRLAEGCGLTLRGFGHRPLGFADVNTTPVVKSAVWSAQIYDRLRGSEILNWAVLRKPGLRAM
jgi:SAM-dependent methyltransferase